MNIYFLIISQLIIVGSQKSESKDIIVGHNNQDNNKFLLKDDSSEISKKLNHYGHNQIRSASDVLNSIKNSIKNAWNYIKNIANNTKEKITNLIQNVKTRAEKMRIEFEKRLNKLKEKMTDIIKKVVGTGELVKICLQDQEEEIEIVLKQILKHVTECMSNSLIPVALLQNQTSLILDESEFAKDLKKNIDICMKTNDVDEECLHEARRHILDEINDKENEILVKRLISGNTIDGVLDTIINCSIEGLIAASSNITMEAIEVIQCVKDQKTNTTV
ncbi:uncharacterized protein LOC113510504 [Galleria mellonella]|uniref:Uncharacterized protein LOC113510504 n=1 Tax=Galleria mellonella TaxID=7137 RepID=A0ABM3MCT2_GALME|nr:uncharacterized protein LOC113510504 [Galleria mellonella]